MKSKKILLFCVLAAMHVIAAQAQPRYYDSKSMAVGLTTTDNIYTYDVGKTFSNHLSAKSIPYVVKSDRIQPKETEQALEQEGFGKMILDLLFERSKGSLSEDLLRRRAWANAQLADVERAEYSVYNPEIILKEDILPILENNYILITHNIYKKNSDGEKVLTAKSWIVFHVDINQKVWDSVMDNWNNLRGYDAIRVGLSYMASGRCKPEHLLKEVSRKVPPLAVRGPIVSKSPYQAFIENAEIPSGERMLIYTQKQLGKKIVSKKIGVARTRPKGDMYTISGVKGDPKKGDMAVLSPTTKIAHSLMLMSQSYSKALRYTIEDRVLDVGSFYSSIDFDFRGGFLNNHHTALYPSGGEVKGLLRSPVFASVGTGATYGWSLVTGVNLDFYWQLQGEVWLSEYYMAPGTYDDPKRSLWYGLDVRVPLGVRASVNLLYPLRLVGGVEWGPFLLGGASVKQSVFDVRGWKRGELTFMAGLRYAF
jgi:hypothetical protein